MKAFNILELIYLLDQNTQMQLKQSDEKSRTTCSSKGLSASGQAEFFISIIRATSDHQSKICIAGLAVIDAMEDIPFRKAQCGFESFSTSNQNRSPQGVVHKVTTTNPSNVVPFIPTKIPYHASDDN